MFSASKTAGPSGYNINNSLRFRSSASAYLNRTLSTPTNNKIWTWSGWVKRGALAGYYTLFSSASPGTGFTTIRFTQNANDDLAIFQFNGSSYDYHFATSQVFRDPASWYHIVVAMDTTQATNTNRMKLYVNGNQVTAFSSSPVGVTYPTQNLNTNINSAVVHRVGAGNYTGNVEQPFDGYMAEVNFIDGQALTPSSFGSTNATTGVWQPAKYTGSYGTNGFYLPFSDIGLTSGSNTGLGKDFSGNSNYWTTNNISVTAGTTYDAMTDSPTNTSATVANYATLNPLDKGAVTLANANLNIIRNSSNIDWEHSRATIQIPSTGKWYFEMVFNSGSTDGAAIGVCTKDFSLSTDFAPGTYANGYAWLTIAAILYANSSASYGTSPSNGDVIMCAFDRDNSTLYFGRNGTWFSSSNPATGTNPAISSVEANVFPFFGARSTANAEANFGQRPFAYTPPTGFKALNTFNLPTPTILQGNKYMDATTYTGTGTSLVTVNAGQFRPDMVWFKARSNAYNHELYDSVRGVQKRLSPNLTNAESTSTLALTSFNNNGFTQGGEIETGGNGVTLVAWQWQAGQGSTSSNTNGSITSTVSVNTTAGFSIVTYTGNGSSPVTIGHGLGVAPKFIIIKDRSVVSSWVVQHTSLGWTQGFLGITTAAASTSTLFSNNTAPTSSVFTVGGYSNNNAENYVAYCWAEIAGFSAFGSYTGNGSADGPFVYTGFRPKFVMIKRTDAANDWNMYDSRIGAYNVIDDLLKANTSAAETTYYTYYIDFLSNGFKLRETDTGQNASGGTYIYMAFAENPFKNALAR